MKVSRRFDASELGTSFFESVDLLLFGQVTDEERNRRLAQLYGFGNTTRSYFIDYDLDTEEYSLLPQAFGTEPSQETILATRKDISTQLRDQLQGLDIQGKTLLVDITSIATPAVFFILKLLTEDVKPSRVFLAYTEPQTYREKLLPDSDDMFELTERFIGIKALPGFLRKTARGAETILVLLIGFEGKRFKYVCGELEVKNENVRVVLGFPAFRPGWQYLAYGGNQSAFEQFQADLYLRFAAANDPFEAYNTLEEILKDERNIQPSPEIAVAPIGTKPHAVGAAIFALHYPDNTRLLYDFPVKARTGRTEGYGITWIYGVTELLQQTGTSS